MEDKHYYNVELLDTSDPEATVMDTQRADDATELASIVQAMETLDYLGDDTELRIKRMIDLDAPLTDEEEAELNELLDELEAMDAIPEEGDILYDPESDPRFGDGMVRIIERANDTASGYVTRRKNGVPITVADQNPGYPSDDPVVIGEYVDGSSKQYAFPVSRLEKC